MGTDKAFVEVDGVAMVERVADTLAAGGCDPVVMVGGDTVLLARFGRPVVPDRFPGQGPVGGVLTALDAAAELAGPVAGSRLVIASCDLPRLDAATVASLAAAVDACDAAVAVTDTWQLSLTAWRASVRDVVAQAWEDGVRSLRELVTAVEHVEVPVDAAALRNVNTPEELSAADGTTR